MRTQSQHEMMYEVKAFGVSLTFTPSVMEAAEVFRSSKVPKNSKDVYLINTSTGVKKLVAV